jgi:leucyl aminopeptidase (aminopeptidase T)
MFLRRLVLLVMILCTVLTTVAEEGKKKEGAVAETYSGKQDQSWEVVQSELAALKTKMDVQFVLVNNLVAEKSNLKGEELSAKMAEVKKQHQKYEQLVVEYNKKNDEFMTRYPERGLKEKRIYKRVKIKSLDSFEDDFTFRGRMNKLHKKVLSQYPKSSGQNQNNNKSNTNADSADEPQNNVTDQIQFKK